MKYRYLQVGEFVRQSDDVYNGRKWVPAYSVLTWNRKVRLNDMTFRRLVNKERRKTAHNTARDAIAAKLLKRWIAIEFDPKPPSDKRYGRLLRETDTFIAQQQHP